jgi:hypothetical protein
MNTPARRSALTVEQQAAVLLAVTFAACLPVRASSQQPGRIDTPRS